MEIWPLLRPSRYLVSSDDALTYLLKHPITLTHSAFLVQLTGASMASGDNVPTSQINRGLHIYMGGVGLQQLFVLCFIGLSYKFQKEMMRDLPKAEQPRVLKLLYVLYAVLTLITVSFRTMIQWRESN